MRGHEKLIEMRRSGVRPGIVFLNDFLCKTDWFETGGKHVVVCVAGDRLQRLDLRFLVGLTVSAVSYEEARARELLEVCQKAGAAVVGAGHAVGCGIHSGTGWCEVWRKSQEVAHG